MEARRAAMMPRVDLVARRDDYSNYQDAGSRDDSRLELRVNFNLFNGGSDVARNRQYRERKNIALDQRDKACRDMRQTLSIAFNETRRLKDQLSYIRLQVDLVEKTRAAYRDQFNIGQRTLLDLLNTQNEYFDARRAQVNADIDLAVAYMRTYAGMGRLLETLELKRADAGNDPAESELTPVDLAALCPPTVPQEVTLDREALNRKAKEMMQGSASGFIGGRPQAIAQPPSGRCSWRDGRPASSLRPACCSPSVRRVRRPLPPRWRILPAMARSTSDSAKRRCPFPTSTATAG
jgi:adhesin transport system outer membrane protein